MVYSPSQLDAADEVDPVAEADVYMAYGRDLQAEEILKDALRSTPGSLAIHHKLLEIYAKRGDAKAFESIAHWRSI
jgi:pilus assembly protein FimV